MMVCVAVERTPSRVRYSYRDAFRTASVTLYYHKGMFAEGVQVFTDTTTCESVTRLSSYHPGKREVIGSRNEVVSELWESVL
jgi:hypothetical protein